MTRIFKIVSEDLWRAAKAEGRLTGAPVDMQDGYIHFSAAHQLRETARRHFKGQTNQLLLAVDPARLGGALKWEPSRGGDLFPHLYGALDTALVEYVEPLPLNEEGFHQFSSDIA